MKFIVAFLLCGLLSLSLAQNSTERPRRPGGSGAPGGSAQGLPCLDDETNAHMKQCFETNKPKGKPQGCRGKSGTELQTCQANMTKTMAAVPDCFFKKIGVTDASGKIDLTATKAYVVKHSNLTNAQNTAAMAAFDSCMASPPKNDPVNPTQSMTASFCIATSLSKNGCTKAASG